MDIRVGDAYLYYVNAHGAWGWIVHGGRVIYDKTDALNYATKVNALINPN